jgi:hypothetical protein
MEGMDNSAGPYADPDGAEPPPGLPAPRRSPRAFGASPLLSTLVTLPLAGAVWIYGAVSAMRGDPLDGAEADAFDRSFTHGFHLLQAMLGAALAVLLAAWLLPPRPRFRPARVILALTAPLLVLTGWAVFSAVVDRPA